MNKQLFADYIESFNRDDFEGFSKYYAPDVVLELGRKKTLHGRQAIVDFYREVKRKIRETLVIRAVVADEEEAVVDDEECELLPQAAANSHQ